MDQRWTGFLGAVEVAITRRAETGGGLFYATGSATRGVGRLLVTGAQTDECVRSTLHGAFVRGYDTTLVGDAHTTEDLSEWGAPAPDKVIDHTNLYWRHQTAPGRTAGVVKTAEVEF